MQQHPLLKNILKHVKLSKQQIVVFEKYWSEATLAKGEYLLQNGNICFYDSYVVSGVIKAYYINADNGNEEIIYFAIDDWWATDIESFSKQIPSIYNIQAIEETTLLQISQDSFQLLLQELPMLERYFRTILESYVATLQKRIIQHNSYDAEQRYYNFIDTYPLIVSKVPQYLIASYLGVTPEFISRIRKKNKF